jgi:hypothetical protein
MQKSAPVLAPASSAQWVHEKMGAQKFRRHQQFLAWWFRLAAPPEAEATATDGQRDTIQRGRTASLILLCLLPIMIGVGVIGLIGPNRQIFYTALSILLLILFVCIPLNRLGRSRGRRGWVHWGVSVSGIVLCLAINVGMYVSLLRAPGGLSANDKDIFYLLVFSEMIIGAILPARWIFVALVVNLTFSGYMLCYGPHTPALTELLHTSLTTILIRVFQMHVIPSVIVWALALTTRESMDRANHAQKVAQLQHDLALYDQREAERAATLREQVTVISRTLLQAFRGDLSVRVPNEVGATLWELAAPINHLLSQLQRQRDAEARLQTLEARLEALHRFEHQQERFARELESTLAAIHTAVQEGKPIRLIAGGTSLDGLQRTLNGKTLQPTSLFK